MGAWGALAFDNDKANDWAYGLEDVKDLSLVESSLEELESDGHVDQDIASGALAACEVIARLLGRPGYNNAYTKKVDLWVAAHPLAPSAALVERAVRATERILGNDSELRELWDGDEKWLSAVEDLRARLKG